MGSPELGKECASLLWLLLSMIDIQRQVNHAWICLIPLSSCLCYESSPYLVIVNFYHLTSAWKNSALELQLSEFLRKLINKSQLRSMNISLYSWEWNSFVNTMWIFCTGFVCKNSMTRLQKILSGGGVADFPLVLEQMGTFLPYTNCKHKVTQSRSRPGFDHLDWGSKG